VNLIKIFLKLFRANLIQYLEDTIKEDLEDFREEGFISIPTKKMKRTTASICTSVPNPASPTFEQEMRADVFQLGCGNQFHTHTHTCYKNANPNSLAVPDCRLRYPRTEYENSTICPTTGEIRLRRADPWVNNFNPWILLCVR
jgi:hypothetical protein